MSSSRASFFVLLMSALAAALACGGGEDSKELEVAPVEPPPPTPPAEVAPEPPPVAAAGSARCPEGWEAITHWQGEYPGPIVHVTTSVEVKGRPDPCAEQASLTCRIGPGFYHPWGDKQAGFVTIRPVERFRLLRPYPVPFADATGATTVEETLPAGTIIEMPTYLSEGFCRLRVGGRETDAQCPEMWEDPQGPVVENLTPGAAQQEQTQLFLADCDDGSGAVWVDVDDALLATPGVKEGTSPGYGEVGPAQ